MESITKNAQDFALAYATTDSHLNNIENVQSFFHFSEADISSLVISIPTGLLTGLLASVLFLYFMRKKIPTITISEHLITDCDPVSQQESLAVKFVNTTKRDLINVSAILYADFYHNDDQSMGTYKELFRKSVPFVPKYCDKDSKMKYAIQATFPFSDGLNLNELKKQYHSLSVKIVATDSYYGTYSTVQKSYPFERVKENSIFELGLNTNSRNK